HTPRVARPTEGAAPDRSPGFGTRRRFRSTTPGLVTRSTARPEGVRLLDRIEAADAGDPLVSPAQAVAMNALRRALAIALAVGETFGEATALGALKRSNLAGDLPEARKTEFSELLAAEALVSLHVFANALAFLLSTHGSEVTVEVGEPQEVLTDNGQLALHGALWDLDQAVAAHGSDDARAIATLAAQAEQLMEKVALRAQTAGQLAAFTGAAWHIEADDLTIRGFTPASKAKSTTLTMTFKKPNEVVGNHIAKYQALRLSKMLMAYDFERKLNPFAELGGFIFTFMGDGKPGTGKTTLIQMMAGLINDYCKVAGYPFRYQNLSTENIDSYQGKSGQNAKAFINTIIDPGAIGFGTIDDIDQLAGKRGDRQSSAGQLEITAVLMESFAGANTVVRGNCTFGMFSNYPENVDDALRQRAGARFLVDGPQTREDYIDILYLLMGKNHDIPLGAHDAFAAQEIKTAVAASFESHSRPHEAGLLKVFDQVRDAVGELDTIAKMGTYLKGIQQADERFTGRAIKNITDAVKVRAMDFELPDEWMENPELFLFKSYDEKAA
ncbi:MAG: ATP-binding protein, partial [Pseudomonadota bacterium]|nr:ATP-binding protein [Pseudomonadota bacterium]